MIIAISAGGILGVREFYFKEEVEEKIIAEEGDLVTIHYTGHLRDERIYDEWRIFDTSYHTIPNVDEPRFTLTYHEERERGTPFEFTLGEGVIDGWNENIEGMKEGESRIFEVPPEKGYGDKSEDLVFELDRSETRPVYERIDKELFESLYGEARSNMVVESPFWGWDVTIISIDRDSLIIRNDPDVGEVYGAYMEEGWKCHVTHIDSSAADGDGIIEIEHEISRAMRVDAEILAGYDEKFAEVPDMEMRAGQSSEGEGIAIPHEDKIILDFNEEVTGTTLVFRVEVISIEKAVEEDEDDQDIPTGNDQTLF